MGQILEPVLAEFPERYPVRQGVRGQSASGLGKQNLAAVPGRADSCGPVDISTRVAIASDDRFAGMQAHSHPQHNPLWPGMPRQCPLSLDCGQDRVLRALEDEEEAFPLVLIYVSARYLNDFPDQSPVICKHLLPSSIAQVLGQTCRSLDIGEEECNGAGREAAHGRAPGSSGARVRWGRGLSCG